MNLGERQIELQRQDPDNLMIMFQVWTDGASEGRRDCAGGWAAVLVSDEGQRMVVYGSESKTTNNRMELRAAVEGLKALGTVPQLVHLTTDSAYLRNGFTRYVPTWQRRGWVTAEGAQVANQDLWLQLIEAVAPHRVRWHKVKGHTAKTDKNELNHLADEYAVKAKQLQTGGVVLL